MALNSIGVNHFRCLEDVSLDLKPLTILLGKNNSGKSSFLRLFPLLKQSCSPRIRGTISLLGSMVDFGDFKDVINKDFGGDYFLVSFKGEFNLENMIRPVFVKFRQARKRKINYALTIKIKNNEEGDYLYISNFELKFEKHIARFSIQRSDELYKKKGVRIPFEITDFVIDDNTYFENDSTTLVSGYINETRLFPELIICDDNLQFANNQMVIKSMKSAIGKLSDDMFGYSLWDMRSFIDMIPATSPEDVLDFIKEYVENMHEYTDVGIPSKLYKALVKDKNKLDDFYKSVLFYYFTRIYNDLEQSLIKLFSSVYYLMPLRANAERFYRSVPLSVNEISPDGSNLVQFYSAMDPSDKKDFIAWMDHNLGFHYDIEKAESMKSIYIFDKNARENEGVNIVDTGFGFSQLLPIITQIWRLYKDLGTERKFNDFIIAIEQPELHLHPALQCKLLNAIASVINLARVKKVSVRIILETHSETFIKHIGRLVDCNEGSKFSLRHEDVGVYVFDKESGKSVVKSSSYDKEGVLKNWPIGFFGELFI